MGEGKVGETTLGEEATAEVVARVGEARGVAYSRHSSPTFSDISNLNTQKYMAIPHNYVYGEIM